MPSTTHIVPLMVGDPQRAKQISDILLAEYGVYVQPINYPTVARGTPMWSSAANVYLSHAWTGVYRVVSTTLTSTARTILREE